jgi:hypothetical protein
MGRGVDNDGGRIAVFALAGCGVLEFGIGFALIPRRGGGSMALTFDFSVDTDRLSAMMVWDSVCFVLIFFSCFWSVVVVDCDELFFALLSAPSLCFRFNVPPGVIGVSLTGAGVETFLKVDGVISAIS